MRILERPQGYEPLTGLSWDEAVRLCVQSDADFVARNPSCAPYHRPTFRIVEILRTSTTESFPVSPAAPWGYEWYQEDSSGLLKIHSAYYDSSG